MTRILPAFREYRGYDRGVVSNAKPLHRTEHREASASNGNGALVTDGRVPARNGGTKTMIGRWWPFGGRRAT
jgi:hypothetical protein